MNVFSEIHELQSNPAFCRETPLKGRVHRDSLKHWERLFRTRDFLRNRYAKHHVLEGPSLDFDCLVPAFQRRMYYRIFEDEHGNPLHVPVKDTSEWYDSALRIGIFHWQVGFSCPSSRKENKIREREDFGIPDTCPK